MRDELTEKDYDFLGEFFRAVVDEPLGPDDPRYVSLYEEEDGLLEQDPIVALARPVRFSSESAQLLAGFRGIGKSTELRRLRKRLEAQGHKVVMLDLKDYVNQSMPVDVSDFLMGLAGAFGEAVEDESLLGKDVLTEGYWERALALLQRTRVELSDVSGELGGKAGVGTDIAGVKKNVEASTKLAFKLNLKDDPTFKRRLQEKMAGHIGALVANVRKFFEDCLKAFKNKYGNDVKVVIIADSMEQIRGTSVNAIDVQASIETLFASHAENIKIPGYHVIYTVPPFLKVRHPNLGTRYGVGAVQMFPAIKIKDKDDGVATAGMGKLRQIIEKRHPDAHRLLGKQEMDTIISASGGHLRDLLRIVAEVIRRVNRLPASPDTITSALDQMRTECLPIATQDALWLARIAKSHGAGLENQEDLIHLARFFDTNMVLCYRNGPEWYDVHPLIRTYILDVAKKVEESERAKAQKT